MKTILTYSIVTLLLIGALSLAQQVILPQSWNFVSNGQRVLLIKGNVANEQKVWLIIEAHNGEQWAKNGFDPIYTRVLCDYKPMFRKLPNKQWEILFTSEIAEGIP
jgi:hypothetical protein